MTGAQRTGATGGKEHFAVESGKQRGERGATGSGLQTNNGMERKVARRTAFVGEHSTQKGCTPVQKLIDEAYENDTFPRDILTWMKHGTRHHRKIMQGDCGNDNEHLTYRNCLYVPNHEPFRLHLMREHHDPPAIGHPERAKTLELLQRKYYWPRMRDDVMRYIRNCHKCQRSRTS